MFPSFEVFGKTFSPYMICALAGVFAALFAAFRLAKKKGLDEYETLFMTLFSFGGVVVFSHLLYAVTQIEFIWKVLTNPGLIKTFDDLLVVLSVSFGGSVFYGGLIGAILVFYVYTRVRRLSFGEYGDIGAVIIPLFHFFGRLGCFFSGCCYGIEWKYGFVYNYSIIESANHIPRFPVQLVEAILNLTLFLLLLYLYGKGKAAHRLLAVYLLIYPAYRFALEFLRGDGYRGFLWGLSTSQIISVILFVLSLGWLIVTSAKKKSAVNTDNN